MTAVGRAPATWDASRLAASIRARELSSQEVLAMYVDRIERLDGPLNSVVTLDVPRAQAAAAAADKLAAQGTWLGPLHGLPVTIKDAIEVRGLRSTGGAVELTDHVPTTSAPAVARLEAAGAVVLGKTNVPRWSGDLQTYNALFGTTNNPCAPDRVPGGSSGGAAVAVACGFCAFALGTDIGGSICIPAYCCGVFGLKPSYGVVPQRGYLDHAGGGRTDVDLNVFGPLARSAADLELLLGVLAAPASECALAWRIELPVPRHTRIQEYHVGVWLDDPFCPTGREELAILRAAVNRLADAGAMVEEAHPPARLAEQVELFMKLVTPALSPSMPEEVAQVAGGSHRDWLRADEQRALLRRTWQTWFEGFDALVCPVMPVQAFPHHQEGEPLARTVVIDDTPRPYTDLLTWTGLVSVLGLPAVAAPVGRTASGLPVGAQVVTAFLRDREAIQIAGSLAHVAHGGYTAPPGF
jgi:amidase